MHILVVLSGVVKLFLVRGLSCYKKILFQKGGDYDINCMNWTVNFFNYAGR